MTKELKRTRLELIHEHVVVPVGAFMLLFVIINFAEGFIHWIFAICLFVIYISCVSIPVQRKLLPLDFKRKLMYGDDYCEKHKILKQDEDCEYRPRSFDFPKYCKECRNDDKSS